MSLRACCVTAAMHRCGELASRSAICAPSLLRGFTEPSRGAVPTACALVGRSWPVCIALVRRVARAVALDEDVRERLTRVLLPAR